MGRTQYFYDFGNLFDFGLVLTTSTTEYILPALTDLEVVANIGFFRLIRICRVVRVVRVVRVLKLFRQLRVIVETVVASISALFWSLVLLGILQLVAGLFICQMLQNHIEDQSLDYDIRNWLYKQYGTSTRALYTLFEMTFSGCWPNYVEPVIEQVSAWYAVPFGLYVTVVVFAVIRIITALFIKETLAVAASDHNYQIQERMRETQQLVGKLSHLFNQLDASGDGVITLSEFYEFLAVSEVQAYLQTLELSTHDAELLFALLEDGFGNVTFDAFMDSIMRLRGQARSMDVIALQHVSKKIVQDVDGIKTLLVHIAKDMETDLTMFTQKKTIRTQVNDRVSERIASRKLVPAPQPTLSSIGSADSREETPRPCTPRPR